MDEKILSIYVIFGFLIVLGYVKLGYQYRKNADLLWNNNNTNIIQDWPIVKYSYNAMIALSFVAGIYLVYYLTTFQPDDTVRYLVYIGSVMFLVYSLLWAYYPFSSPSWTVKVSLGLVAIGAILIMSGIGLNVNEGQQDVIDIVALVASIILVIQTGIFDFWIWNGFKPFNKGDLI